MLRIIAIIIYNYNNMIIDTNNNSYWPLNDGSSLNIYIILEFNLTYVKY